MKGHRVLPFYMTYPMPMAYEEEDVMMRDLEYLQQLYPTEAKRYQKKVSDILDKMDYEGSLIYDEYPDRFILYQLAREIADMIRKEDESTGIYSNRDGVNDSISIRGRNNGSNDSIGLNDNNDRNANFGFNRNNGMNSDNGINGDDGTNGSNGFNGSNGMNGSNGINGSNGMNDNNGSYPNRPVPPVHDDDCMEQMILIILFYEIYKRRHNNGRGILRFY